ncbi:MAG: hypothetical protein QXP63_05465 [Conexivisphaerales archaeon]
MTRSGTYVIPRACSMIREEDRGKVVSYLRKRGATVVLWIPSRKEKSSWSYRSLKYLFNTATIHPHRKLSGFLAQTFCKHHYS